MLHLMGIDPGLQGSLVSIRDGEVRAWPMPLCDGRGSGRRIDIVQVAYIIRMSAPNLKAHGPDLITIEGAQPMPKQGLVSTFNYGVGYGQLLAILTLRIDPFRIVSPQAWKRKYGLAGKPKEAALEVACRLVPELRNILYDGDGKPLHPRNTRISMSEAALLALSGNELTRNSRENCYT